MAAGRRAVRRCWGGRSRAGPRLSRRVAIRRGVRTGPGKGQRQTHTAFFANTALAQNAQNIIRHIHAGQATVSALAAFIRKPYARVLLQLGCDMIPAVTPDPAPFCAELDAAQSALDHAVVIETSAVMVATTLPGRWPQLRGAFTELRMTRDAWNDLQESRDILRDPGTTFSLGYEPSGRARIDPGLDGDAHEQLSRRFAGTDHAMEDLTLIGTPDLGHLARFTFGGT